MPEPQREWLLRSKKAEGEKLFILTCLSLSRLRRQLPRQREPQFIIKEMVKLKKREGAETLLYKQN